MTYCALGRFDVNAVPFWLYRHRSFILSGSLLPENICLTFSSWDLHSALSCDRTGSSPAVPLRHWSTKHSGTARRQCSTVLSTILEGCFWQHMEGLHSTSAGSVDNKRIWLSHRPFGGQLSEQVGCSGQPLCWWVKSKWKNETGASSLCA